MKPAIHEEKKQRSRLEDSFSLPENQRKLPEDDYVVAHEKEMLKKWHEKNLNEEWERLRKYSVNR